MRPKLRSDRLRRGALLIRAMMECDGFGSGYAVS